MKPAMRCKGRGELYVACTNMKVIVLGILAQLPADESSYDPCKEAVVEERQEQKPHDGAHRNS